MSKDNKVDELLDFIENYGVSSSSGEFEAYPECRKEAKAKLFKLISEEVIAKRDMTFDNTYPVFSSLEEYMEHVATVREVQRKEQKLALERLFGDE